MGCAHQRDLVGTAHPTFRGFDVIRIQTVPVDRLKPAPYNPRIPLKPGTPGYRRLERSLNEFGLVQPIVWNERTGHVVAGHQRLEILKNQGVQDVDVAVVSLPLEREKALNVALNNAQVGSDWNPDKLIDVMTELNRLPDFDATLTGFDEQDINDLLLAPDPVLPQDTEPSADDLVRVTLEVPQDRWESVRPELDTLIAELNLTVHIKLPSMSD